MQRIQQPGYVVQVIKADVAGGVAVQQGMDRVIGPGLAQLIQQQVHVPRVVEEDLGGGVAGQQGMGRVAGPGIAQRTQKGGDGARVIEADAADSPSGGAYGVAGVHLAQMPDEPGRGVRVPQSYGRCPQGC